MTKAQKIAHYTEFLDKVIDDMTYIGGDIKSITKSNLSKLIDESLKYSNLGKSFQFSANDNLNDSINDILDKLKTDLFYQIYMRCEDVNKIAHESNDKSDIDRNIVAAFITSKIAGDTLENRIDNYVQNIKSEIEAYVAAGIFKGMNRTQILAEYINNISKPFAAKLLFDAYKETGFKAERILSKGISFGTGKYVSSYNNLKRLGQDTIFKTYNKVQGDIWRGKPDYIGWMTFRGSTYPCGYCDSQVGVSHSRDESYWGWHNKCVCLMIPIYKGDLV